MAARHRPFHWQRCWLILCNLKVLRHPMDKHGEVERVMDISALVQSQREKVEICSFAAGTPDFQQCP